MAAMIVKFNKDYESKSKVKKIYIITKQSTQKEHTTKCQRCATDSKKVSRSSSRFSNPLVTHFHLSLMIMFLKKSAKA